MNNYFPYNDKEAWEHLVEEAFSPDAPEPQFSLAYQARKKQMEESLMKKTRKPMKKSAVIAIAAAAALAVLTPATAFAASRIYQARIEQTAAYQKTVHIETGDSVSDQIMALSYNWLPDGVSYAADGPYGGKYRDANNGERGFTPTFWKIDGGSQNIAAQINYATGQTEYTTASGNSVIYIKRDGWSELWVAFTGTKYAAQLYTNQLSDEEVRQLAEGMTLTPADTETASVWDDSLNREEGDGGYTVSYDIDKSRMQRYQVGESIQGTAAYGYTGYTFSVEQASLQDNFDGITTDDIGMAADYSGYLDADGKITTVRSLVKLGDGVNTLDEVVKQENIQQKVLRVTLRCTNNSSEDQEVTVFPELFQITDQSTMTNQSFDTATGESISHDTTDELMTDDSMFSFRTDWDSQKNNLTNLAPGESATVELAFLVDADNVGNLYLNLFPSTDGSEGIADGDPVVDLCDLK